MISGECVDVVAESGVEVDRSVDGHVGHLPTQVPPGTGRWSWLGRVAWALLVATALTIVVAAFRASFAFDESYNLQVVLNLAHGHGYATDGLWYGDGTRREAFDPVITTGPTLLLPISAVVLALGEHPWVYRLVPVAFFLLLLVAWGRVGRDVAGRTGMFAAVAGVLIVNTCAATTPGSPLLGAGDVLGEVAATALLVLAVRRLYRPGWSGLLFGLALMSKMLVLLAGPAMLVGLVLAPSAIERRWPRAMTWCVTSAVPVLAWQVVRLVALGPRLAWARDVEFWHTSRRGDRAWRATAFSIPGSGRSSSLRWWGSPGSSCSWPRSA
jgi:hypothetical protein